MGKARIDIPTERIAEFCRANHIRRLALFGSVLRDDFGPDSDVDVLVEFEPEARVGLLRLAGFEIELSEILGHKVDLNTPGFISDYFRDEVLAEAEVQYEGLVPDGRLSFRAQSRNLAANGRRALSEARCLDSALLRST